MSEPIDDKALDEYLSGRSQISQRYRALADDAREIVPPELDRRILAQARDAVAQAEAVPADELTRLRTKRRRLMQWGVPAALAASAVLVISIVIRSGVQHEVQAVQEPPLPTVAAPSASAAELAKRQSEATVQDDIVSMAPPQNAVTEFPPPAAPPAVSAKEASSARRVAPPPPAPAPLQEAPQSEQRPASAERAAADASPAHVSSPYSPPAAPSQEPASVAKAAPIRQRIEQRAAAAAPPASSRQAPYEPAAAEARVESERENLPQAAAASAPRQPPPAVAGNASNVPESGAVASPQLPGEKPESADLHRDPQRWLEHIRELRKNGKSAEADNDWKEFRARYPDYPVTETDAARGKP